MWRIQKKLYIGFIFSCFSHWFGALPIMAAAHTVDMLINQASGGAPFDRKWIGLSLLFIAAMVFMRFVFDYLRARFQESISYELVARDRTAIGDALKRVSLLWSLSVIVHMCLVSSITQWISWMLWKLETLLTKTEKKFHLAIMIFALKMYISAMTQGK